MLLMSSSMLSRNLVKEMTLSGIREREIVLSCGIKSVVAVGMSCRLVSRVLSLCLRKMKVKVRVMGVLRMK